MKGVGAKPNSLKIIALLVLPLLVSCSPRDDHFGYGRSSFATNGERIYFTGTSASGKAITASGGTGMMSMHRQMHGGGCAICHGEEREGRRLWPQFWIKAPALTAQALFSDSHGHDGHDDHGNYNAETLRRVITDGLTPAGEALDYAMPRWKMSQSDLDDLVAYLQQPRAHD